jgi:hypothetical protein
VPGAGIYGNEAFRHRAAVGRSLTSLRMSTGFLVANEPCQLNFSWSQRLSACSPHHALARQGQDRTWQWIAAKAIGDGTNFCLVESVSSIANLLREAGRAIPPIARSRELEMSRSRSHTNSHCSRCLRWAEPASSQGCRTWCT